MSDEIVTKFEDAFFYINLTWPSIERGLKYATIAMLISLIITRFYLIGKGRRC